MNLLLRTVLPFAVTILAAGAPGPVRKPAAATRPVFAAPDTVIYPIAGYKLRRTLSLEEVSIRDTASQAFAGDTLALIREELPRLSARDSLKALADSSQWAYIDSVYTADSLARARAEFESWLAGLSRQERKRYELEQKIALKLARTDSLNKVREERRNIRDSIAETTPRILETYTLPQEMQYKRLVAWTLDPDFGSLSAYVPDTSYNYHFHDYPFQRRDVNASWLGVAGSPVRYYNWFLQDGGEGVEFYKAQESWSYSHKTLPHYNTKVPYTELAYYGTLFAGDEKESDNLHIFTSQNITPALNFSLLYDRYGGGGILESEQTINKTTVAQANYLGKRYTLHTGYIYNMVSRQENGGISDIGWIRDTTVDGRDVRVLLSGARSRIKKNTVFLDQQLRIPFTFINQIRARRDSTYRFNADSLDRNITTAFVGHSTEWSTYTRKYNDYITDAAGAAFYNNVFRYGNASADSLRVMHLDNKFYLRLQPWSSEGVVSKLDVGVGDYLDHYFDSTSVRPTRHVENSFYLYAGAEGKLLRTASWDAKMRYVLLGDDSGDFFVNAHAGFSFYPFRRDRQSPVAFSARFETRLENPDYYQQHLNLNHFSWDNSFGKISTTRLEGRIDIPLWKLSAGVGYALLANNTYYGTDGVIRQNDTPMSVLTATLDKEFRFGPLHLQNRALMQFSSNTDVLPLPTLALNLRYYMEFVVQRNERRENVMVMQVGVDAYANTPWYAPAWNPNLGVFHNQAERQYTNGPWFDIFINVQWKRACVFLKYQNAGGGWPLFRPDYFSADRYIVTQNGMEGLKFGVFWPFYTQPSRNFR